MHSLKDVALSLIAAEKTPTLKVFATVQPANRIDMTLTDRYTDDDDDDDEVLYSAYIHIIETCSVRSQK